MFFRAGYQLKQVLLRLKQDEFNYQLLKSNLTINIAISRHQEPDSLDIICRLFVEAEPNEQVRVMFEQLSRDEVPPGYKDPHHQRVSTNGRKVLPATVYMPEIFQEFVDRTISPMRDTANRVLEQLPWRFNRRGASLLNVQWPEFSFDNETWHYMPSEIDPTAARVLDAFSEAPFGEAEMSVLQEQLQSDSGEPLAHILYREAWGLRTHNPRSSLLIGFAAAEVGVKRHVVRMLPITQNLIMPMPSPPIKDLLNYLDDIPHDPPRIGEGKLIPQSIKKALVEMATLRNKITHTGEHDPKGDQLTFDFLTSKLEAIKDLFWLLDYYAGHQWAIRFVSQERLDELKPSQKP